jgi:hypothetical protein
LGARQWDLDKAEAMMRDAVKWRNSLEPIDKYRDLVSLSLAVQLSVLMTVRSIIFFSFFSSQLSRSRQKTSLDERFATLLLGGTMPTFGTWTRRCA